MIDWNIHNRQSDWTKINACVVGLGIAGFAAADALIEMGAQVSVIDRANDLMQKEHGTVLEILGATIYLDYSGEIPQNTNLLIVSPGVRPNSDIIKDATKKGIEIWGEVELAWRLRPLENPAPWLFVSGTNGKTTTTIMLSSILTQAGLRAPAVGNIGDSLVSAVMDPIPADVLAIEIGAPQLPFVKTASPHSAVVLNLAHDHLDFFGNFENYAQTKARTYRNVQKSAIFNVEDSATEKMVEDADVVEGTRAIGFTMGTPSVSMLGLVEDILVDRAFVADRKTHAQELCSVSDVQPSAPHNIANALAAAALARSYGVEPVHVRDGLRSFVPAPHRIYTVGEFNGITFIDDSKATNTHAAQMSLKSFENVVWIAGGQAKGQDFGQIVQKNYGNIKAVVLLGQDKELIAQAFNKFAPQIPVKIIERTDEEAMKEVVVAAITFAQSGDTVLLAPGCASWDMFKDYKARGNAFSDAVKSLLGKN
jgi:UDP-N-acetylmuramoylalanine--D-glutamate ligase